MEQARALALMNKRHPFPVQRLKEIDAWIDSGGYATVLSGEYPRRSDEPHTNKQKPWDVWRESASAAGVTGWIKGIRSRFRSDENEGSEE